MDQEKDFAIRLGRIRAAKGKVTPGRAYANRVLKAANLARGGTAPAGGGRAKTSKFTGSRIGRGAGAGSVLSSRAGMSRFRQRRVMVKARIVKLVGKGMATARAHLHYVQRDGVTRDGRAGELYSAENDKVDGRAFLDRSDGDRHQFRFIVSPEEGTQYDDLKSVTRRLMTRMEEDLGTKLDWVAVDHFNTGHPHTHILIRGRDDQGKDLVIARDYITDGVRERAAEIVSLDLGPRTDHEIDRSLQAEMTQDRFTTIDKWLAQRKSDTGIVAAIDDDGRRQSLLAGRLNHLQTLGLATPAGAGTWQLDAEAESTLRAMGRRGDIINGLSYDLSRAGQSHLLHDAIIHDAGISGSVDIEGEPRPLIGQLLWRGLSDEVADSHYVVVNATDGRMHVVDIGEGGRTPSIPEGAVISVTSRELALKQTDVRISEVAARNDGRYSIDRHLVADPTATHAFATTHVRRLEAIRRATGGVERLEDGTFRVGSKYLGAAEAYERLQADRQPVKIEVLSLEPPQRQAGAQRYTWLDRELSRDTPESLSPNGFGRQVADALGRRRQWLIEQGLASNGPGGSFIMNGDLKGELTRREVAEVGGRWGQDLGKPMGQVFSFERIEGQLAGKADLGDSSFAVVERARDFVLVPWRDVLENQIGKQLSGIMREGGIDWTIGLKRGLGIDM